VRDNINNWNKMEAATNKTNNLKTVEKVITNPFWDIGIKIPNIIVPPLYIN